MLFMKDLIIDFQKSFSNIAKKINEKITKYRLDSIDIINSNVKFAGTLGPIDKLNNSNGLKNFYRLSNVSFSYNTINILDYLKEFNIIIII